MCPGREQTEARRAIILGPADQRSATLPRVDHPRWQVFAVLERCFADEAVMADALDVEQTSVGRKADLAQFLKIFGASADREIAGVVDGRFSSKRLSLLVVLLDAGFFVFDVTRGQDAVGDDAGAEPTRCAPDDLTVEHQ